MKDIVAANRYAQALFELVHPLRHDEEVEAELESLSESLSRSPEIERFLANPRLTANQRREILLKLYPAKDSLSQTLLNFFELLFKKGRFSLVHEIALSFRRIADQAQGQAVAEIRSAVALDAAQEREIIARIEKVAGCRLTVKKTVDPALIGGVSVKVGNKVLDGSVRHQLDLIKKELTKIGTI